jgi:dTDP-4-dehydrorhamnose reductase
MRPRRILITGASGLLGINLTLETAKRHHVFGLVGKHPVQTDAFQVIQADLLAHGAVERILEDIQPDWVIHCAALADVDACEAEPARALQLNSELPAKLAKYVARGGARLIHVSTDAVFDGQHGNYREEDLPNPLSIYAKTNLDGELAVAETNPEAIIARVNLFGWSISGRRSLAEFFYTNLSAGRSVKGFTDVFFCPLLANDLADIFLIMLDLNLSGLFHVVSNDCVSKYSFGVQIARRFGLDENLIEPISVKSAGLKAVRSPKLTLCTEKLERTLGKPLPSLSTGLNHFYTLFQQGYPQKLNKMGNPANG